MHVFYVCTYTCIYLSIYLSIPPYLALFVSDVTLLPLPAGPTHALPVGVVALPAAQDRAHACTVKVQLLKMYKCTQHNKHVPTCNVYG